MITGPRIPSKTDIAERLVIFLHGYGSNGDDLLGLAPFFQQVDQAADFVSPNAIERSPFNAGGFQWFSIPYIDGSSTEEMTRGLMRAHKELDAFIDNELNMRGLSEENLVLVGFSQGTMMALHTAFRRPKPLAGVIGFSGRLLFPELLQGEISAKPPVVLIHGEDDDVVPVNDSIEAAKVLKELGVKVKVHLSPRTAHSIAQDGLQNAIEFYEGVVKG